MLVSIHTQSDSGHESAEKHRASLLFSFSGTSYTAGVSGSELESGRRVRFCICDTYKCLESTALVRALISFNTKSIGAD